MTGIVLDVYKGSLYVFADGRVTEDDFVFTDEDDKIVKVDDENIFTMCGEAVIIDQALELFADGKLDNDGVKKITGSGTVIWLNTEKVVSIDIDNTNPATKNKDEPVVPYNGNAMSSYKHKALPMFLGSGKKALSGAYYALECQKAPDEKQYIVRMRKAYKAACERIASMGPLKQVESIKISKDK